MISDRTNVVIFSCNRACQVHACLQSFYKHFKSEEEPTVTIIWKATSEVFRKGYEKVQSHFPESEYLIWDEEVNFRSQTIKGVRGFPWAPSQFTMFLVDDIIFVNDVATSDKQFDLIRNNVLMLGLSLRLHDGVTRCYATNEDTKVPKFVKGCVWSWVGCQGDWGYPMSVDGNIFNTEFINSLVETTEYNNPNTFEAALDMASKRPDTPDYLSCYPEGPRLINIPANRVQSQYKNRFAKGFTPEELNEKYLEGKLIDIDSYKGVKPSTVHVPVEIKFANSSKKGKS